MCVCVFDYVQAPVDSAGARRCVQPYIDSPNGPLLGVALIYRLQICVQIVTISKEGVINVLILR